MTVILHLPVLKYDLDFGMWYDFDDDDDADDSLLFLAAGRPFGSVQLITKPFATSCRQKTFPENVFA